VIGWAGVGAYLTLLVVVVGSTTDVFSAAVFGAVGLLPLMLALGAAAAFRLVQRRATPAGSRRRRLGLSLVVLVSLAVLALLAALAGYLTAT